MEAREAVKYSIVDRTALNKEYLDPNVNSARIEKPGRHYARHSDVSALNLT